ncbi:MAG: hypothetical protein K0M55_15855 [Rhizobium sp.]|nr:hypothetical protein [Rhizobium sp.]MBW8319272.1 hypothetical protein [Rhizobium sp.]
MDNSREMNPPMFWEMQPDGQWVSLELGKHPQAEAYLDELIRALETAPAILLESGPIEHLKL